MGRGRRERATRYVIVADEAIGAVRAGRRVESVELTALAAWGFGHRIDREIRKVHPVPTAWASTMPTDVRRCAVAHPALLVALGSHPDGRVRAAAVDLARGGEHGTGALHRPGPARMMAQRAADHVPAVRAVARSAVRALLETELRRTSQGQLLTNVEVAARELLAVSRSVDFSPELTALAIELLGPPSSSTT